MIVKRFSKQITVPDEMRADFAYWGVMPHWTADEVTALALGVNPTVSLLETVLDMSLELPPGATQPPMWQSQLWMVYTRLRTRLRRAVEIGELGSIQPVDGEGELIHSPISRTAWVDWLRRNDIAFPSELEPRPEDGRTRNLELKTATEELAQDLSSLRADASDYNYWSRLASWTGHEATALFLGLNPEKHVTLIVDHSGSELRREYDRLHRLIDKALSAGELGPKTRLGPDGTPWDPDVSAETWLDWAANNGVVCSEELATAVDTAKTSTNEVSVELPPRQKANLERIVGVLLKELLLETGKSEATLIRQILDAREGTPGISKSNLEKVFAEAKRRLED